MPPTILVAYDFSHAADAALRWTVELQKSAHGKTVVVHVIDAAAMAMGAGTMGVYDCHPDEMEGAVQTAIQRAGMTADLRVILGTGIGRTILETATEVRADMVVTGTHGRGLVERILVGSVAEYLIRHATVPVVVVPRPQAVPTPT